MTETVNKQELPSPGRPPPFASVLVLFLNSNWRSVVTELCKALSTIFPRASAHSVHLCHILVILKIFELFSLLLFVKLTFDQ